MNKKIPLIKTSTGVRVVSKATVDIHDGMSKYSNSTNSENAYNEISSKIKEWVLTNNLVILAGAGTSISTGNDGKTLDTTTSKHTGKTVSQIWEACKNDLNKEDISILQKLVAEPNKGFQLERFITKIEMYSQVNGNDTNKQVVENVRKCNEVRGKIIEIIKRECDLHLHELSPHKKFLRSLMAARNSSRKRVQVYTLNYDTLFEQAGEMLNATIVDGFSFTRQPKFHGSNFELDIVKREKNRVHDQENYEEKVFQLYKLHGSLDWELSDDKKTVSRIQNISKKPVIIPPSNQKFEQSYQMPFFEMMSRFQQTLRSENTVLVVIGYSFSDLHINRAILEALESNLNFELVVISPTITDVDTANEVTNQLNRLVDTKSNNNITLISDTFQRFMTNFPQFVANEMERLAEKSKSEESVKEGVDEAIPF